jgi:leucyl-tRNA synthetase
MKLPLLNKTIEKVTGDINNFRFNTAISQLMILLNSLREESEAKDEKGNPFAVHFTYFDNIADMKKILILLSPFAPHITEELWEKLGHKESIFLEKWPQYDPELAKDEEIELVIQVNGKVRDKITVSADIEEEEAKRMATESEKARMFIAGKEIKKIIYIKGRLVSIVV